MSRRVLVAVLAVAVLATGCGERAAGGGGNDVKGKVFTSTTITEQGRPRTLVEGTKVELRFTDDGRLLASAGCNQMQGPVTTGGGKLTVTDLSTTDMACTTPGLQEQDEWLAKLLAATPNWRMDGANLVITGSDTEIVLATEAPATLEGGTWTVDGLVTKDAVSSVPGGVTATVSFKDGFIYVQGGCNSGSTNHSNARKYEVDGRKITFGSLNSTLMMCDEQKMAVERAVFDTFGLGEVTYQIDRNTLTLTTESGKGLRLRK